jgi:hypothetical protein
MPAVVEEIAPGYMRVRRSEAERRARYQLMAELAKEQGLEQLLKEYTGREDVSELLPDLYALLDEIFEAAEQGQR